MTDRVHHVNCVSGVFRPSARIRILVLVGTLGWVSSFLSSLSLPLSFRRGCFSFPSCLSVILAPFRCMGLEWYGVARRWLFMTGLE